MQLYVDNGNIDQAIAELEQALRIASLQNVIAERERLHKPRGELRRRLELLRAEQIKNEVAA